MSDSRDSHLFSHTRVLSTTSSLTALTRYIKTPRHPQHSTKDNGRLVEGSVWFWAASFLFFSFTRYSDSFLVSRRSSNTLWHYNTAAPRKAIKPIPGGMYEGYRYRASIEHHV